MTDDLPDITNAERASRFQAALTRYNDEWDTASNLIDLLADARHWCDRNDQCYGDLDRIAYDHYLVELWEERRAS
ncbi:MAG: hypothetical protein EDM82_08490 [Cyanobacteria bacterium CYA]|nr:MAG: hypothetical protein EDM82_08490 [Cyanobacteria bacterium CYA]